VVKLGDDTHGDSVPEGALQGALRLRDPLPGLCISAFRWHDEFKWRSKERRHVVGWVRRTFCPNGGQDVHGTQRSE
jgi:hypothetical protein